MGIASTKTLAKVAANIAKKDHRHKGVYVLTDKEDIDIKLKNIDVSDIWGVGRKISKQLYDFNTTNGYQLKNINKDWIKKKYGVVSLRIVEELNGVSCIPLSSKVSAKKGITTSRSFGKPVTEFEAMHEAVSSFVARAAEKLRKQKSAAGVVSVYILTNRFERDTYYYNHKVIELPNPSNITPELIKYAIIGLKQIFKKGYKYKKAGIMLLDIVPDDQIQLNLFKKSNLDKTHKLMKTIDKLNIEMGNGTLFYASEGVSQIWKMKSEMRSPCYTTRWDNILSIDMDKI